MAKQYYLSLLRLKEPVTVLGRSEDSVLRFNEEMNAQALPGSLQKNKEKLKDQCWKTVFIAVNEEQIAPCLSELQSLKVENIIIEKPGASSFEECQALSQKFVLSSSSPRYWIAYNRRFYASVQKIKKLVQNDGGILAAQFDFTELSDKIRSLSFPHSKLKNWIFLNSSHVIDLAFFIIGEPQFLESFNRGNKSWHDSGDYFSGSGVSQRGIPFHYASHWDAPGRWSVEILTQKNRYFLSPLEELQRQQRNSFQKENIPLEKPKGIKEGVFELTTQALKGDFTHFLPYSNQAKRISLYQTIKNGGRYLSHEK